MCLYHPKRIEVKEPLKCYKVLEKGFLTYRTPFQDVVVPRRIVKGKKKLIANECTFEPICERDILGRGFIHCYPDLGSLYVDWTEFYKLSKVDEYEIFECEVPVGVECYEGMFDDVRGIAGREIRFLRRMDEKELVEWYEKYLVTNKEGCRIFV